MIDDKTKEKVWNLYKKGNTTTDIATICKISVPSARKIIRESEDCEETDFQEEKPIETDSIIKEDSEEKTNQLIYNIKRIAKITGRPFPEFLDEMEYLMNEYLKVSDKPIYLLDFVFDVSVEMIKMDLKPDKEKIREVLVNLAEEERFLSGMKTEIAENEGILKEIRKEIVILDKKRENVLKEIKEARSYKNQIVRGFLFSVEGEKLKKKIKEKDFAMNNLKKQFSEIGGKVDSEYGEIINNQNLTLEMLEKTIRNQADKITIYKEKFDEFLISYPEAKNCWDSFISNINELNGVKTEQ